MQYRNLGKTDLKVSVIGFGAFPLRNVGFKKSLEVLNRSLDLGVNFIDTARSYGDSEKKIGAVLKERGDECFIATKTNKHSAEEAMRDVETSLRILNVKKIDLLQIHGLEKNGLKGYRKVVGPNGALHGLKKLKALSKIDHIGIAVHYYLDLMKEAIESQEFETIMISFSPLDQEGVAAGIIPLAKEQGIGVIVMKSLLEGDLTTPGSAGGWQAGFHGMPGRHPIPHDPLVEGCIRFILSVPGVSTVIPGMTSLVEVEEDTHVGDMRLEMTEEERRNLYSLIGSLGRRFNPFGQICLHCGYCEPCPEGVRISDIYRAWDIYNAYPKHLKTMGLNLYRAMEAKPSSCNQCAQCESKCPARLPISSQIKEIGERMEGSQQAS